MLLVAYFVAITRAAAMLPAADADDACARDATIACLPRHVDGCCCHTRYTPTIRLFCHTLYSRFCQSLASFCARLDACHVMSVRNISAPLRSITRTTSDNIIMNIVIMMSSAEIFNNARKRRYMLLRRARHTCVARHGTCYVNSDRCHVERVPRYMSTSAAAAQAQRASIVSSTR